MLSINTFRAASTRSLWSAFDCHGWDESAGSCRKAFRPKSRAVMSAAGWAWRAAIVAGSIWLVAGIAARGQTRAGAAYDGAIEALCRGYAAAQQGMPADLMFSQCMSERHCRVSAEAPGYRCEPPGPMTWHGGGY